MFKILVMMYAFMSSSGVLGQDSQGHNHVFDYRLVHTGVSNETDKTPRYKFSTSRNPDYILESTSSLHDCKELCSENEKCL